MRYTIAYGHMGCVAVAVAICACNGSGGSSSTFTNPPVVEDVNRPSTGEPHISWQNAGAFSAAVSGSVSLDAAVAWTTSGIKQVDFLIDGMIVGTMAYGAKMPGVPIFEFVWRWDTTNYADGPHTVTARVTDNVGRIAETPTITASVVNHVTISPTLVPIEPALAGISSATGDGQFAVDLATGEIVGGVALSGVAASAVHVHEGYAGATGAQILSLIPASPGSQHWRLPVGSALTPIQLEEFRRGALYIDVDSDAYPNGELRAQLK